MNKAHKELYKLGLCLLVFILMGSILLFSGCTAQEESTQEETAQSTEVGDNAYTSWKNETYTTITLNGTTATVDGEGAQTKDGLVTVTQPGIYVISGSLTNGSIVVNSTTDGTVRLVLNGATIHSDTSAPIYIKAAGKAMISLEPGTTNTLSDGTAYTYSDTANQEPDAALFSKDDLAINGTGTLKVTSTAGDAIKGKDEVILVEGTYEITAADDGIMGKDRLQIFGGTYTITASGDGLKATNDTDASSGTIAIAGGTYTITAGADAIQAVTALTIADGDFTIKTGSGSTAVVASSESAMPMGPGVQQADETTEDTGSYKGLKCTGALKVSGGTFNLDTQDDAVHANDTVTIDGGTFTIASGDDGIHGDTTLTINGGTVTINQSYEGLEAGDITINDGTIKVVASDDGINVAGGDGSTTTDDRAGAGNFNETGGSNTLTIAGGTTYVDATGDGLDANGSIAITGGIVLVDGPTNTGNGALDYDGTCDISGGILVAAGASGMAQAPSTSSTQGAIGMTYDSVQAGGTMVNLTDSSGKSILSYTPSKDYSAISISAPDIKSGESYVLSSGGSDSGTAIDALVQGGSYSGGTQVVSFTMSSTVMGLSPSGESTLSDGMGGGGAPGGAGGGRGGAPAAP